MKTITALFSFLILWISFAAISKDRNPDGDTELPLDQSSPLLKSTPTISRYNGNLKDQLDTKHIGSIRFMLLIELIISCFLVYFFNPSYNGWLIFTFIVPIVSIIWSIPRADSIRLVNILKFARNRIIVISAAR